MLDVLDTTTPATKTRRLTRKRRNADPAGGRSGTDKLNGTTRPRLQLPGHISTTANAGVLYPGMGSSVCGVKGILLGTDELTCHASFHFEIIQAQLDGVIDNTNMMVFGLPGKGKSSLVKTMFWRLIGAYGPIRYPVIVSVKDEYRQLAARAGMASVRLGPDGDRVNPLGRALPGETPQATAQRRTRMVVAMCGTLLGRELTLEEKVALYDTLVELGRIEVERNITVSLVDLATVVSNPPNVLTAKSYGSIAVKPIDEDDADRPRARGDYTSVMGKVNLALNSFLDGPLQGLFDGQTPIEIDPTRNRGLVVDLADLAGHDDILPVALVLVAGWLQEVMRADWGHVKKVQCFDEAWYLFDNPEVVRFMQQTWKLGRSYGFANVAVMHRPSDLWSAAPIGSALATTTKGLLTDTAVVVSYAQRPDQLDEFGSMVGWSDAECRRIVGLRKAQSLWVIGDSSRAVLHHQLGSDVEIEITETNQSLRAGDS